MIGKQIGNYNVLKKLGEGGMGAVFQARDMTLERNVAIKVIAPELARNPKLMARFRVEAIAQAKLNHNNITTIHAFDNQQDTYYIVMEYVEGMTLRELIRHKGIIPVSEAIQIFNQILEAIAYAHSKGVIHRDIKPSNIFLTHDGVVKIGDFGIAKVEGVEGLTRVGSTIGSPLYSSPEQVRGEKVDARTDIYSLGMTFYEMLTGRLPFPPTDNMSEYRVMKEVLEKTPPPPSTYNQSIPSVLDAVITKGIHKSADQRFQSVTEFRQAIENPQIPKKSGRTPLPQKKQDSPASPVVADSDSAAAVPISPERRKQLIILGIILGAVVFALLIYIVIASSSASMSSLNDPSSEGLAPGQRDAGGQSPAQFPAIVQTKKNPSPSAAATEPAAPPPSGGTANTPSTPAPSPTPTSPNPPAASGDYYIAQAKASYYTGNKDNVRKFTLKALDLGVTPSFPIFFHFDKKKKILGSLVISKKTIDFLPQNPGGRQFSLYVKGLKDVYDDSISDIGGIFKKKKDKDNPSFIIKDKNNNRYKLEITIREGKMRGFIKKIIETVMNTGKS